MAFSRSYHFRQRGRMGLLWLLLVLCSCTAFAQDDELDTTIVGIDTAVAEDSDNEEYEDDTEVVREHIPDTPVFRAVADTTALRLRKDKAFAYANDPAYWTKEVALQTTHRKGFWDYFDDFFHLGAVRTIFYTLLVLLFLFVIYRVVMDNKLFLSRRSANAMAGEDELADTALDDATLEQKIRQAIQEKDYRVAVRYLYLKTLRSLDNKGWIRYHAQATNYDYQRQVNQHGAGREFGFLTYVYEYVWYGEFALNEGQFNQVQQNFQQFYNTVRS